MATLTVERKGGLAGIGLPGSRIRSRGQVEWESLSAEEQKMIDRLFALDGKRESERTTRDTFTYKLTRSTADSTESVEVGEEAVPQVLRQSVKDELA